MIQAFCLPYVLFAVKLLFSSLCVYHEDQKIGASPAAAQRVIPQPVAVRPPQQSNERPPHPQQAGSDRPRQPGGAGHNSPVAKDLKSII